MQPLIFIFWLISLILVIHFYHWGWRSFDEELLLEISEQKKFVHINTAYSDVCNLAHLPCGGNREKFCPVKKDLKFYKKIIIKDMSNNCFGENILQQNLYKYAALNIFMSPLNKQTTEKLLSLKFENSYILNPLIDTSLFKNNHTE